MIHSELHITSTHGFFCTRAHINKEFNTYLSKIDILIIDEISMVSDQLLNFLSDIFASIHNNTLPFGGINVILAGDLAQLPPITGQSVFCATAWPLFYLLFLKNPPTSTRRYKTLPNATRSTNRSNFYQIIKHAIITLF